VRSVLGDPPSSESDEVALTYARGDGGEGETGGGSRELLEVGMSIGVVTVF
jgi:hypothetical protein